MKKIHFFQKDNKIEKIEKGKGFVLLPSFAAWEKFTWTKKYYQKKPKGGYFLWAKESLSEPFLTCVAACTKKISQNLENLLVVEQGKKIKIKTTCFAQKRELSVSHQAKGKVLLKKGAILDYENFHYWGKKDKVSPSYEFFLEKESKLNYFYKNFSSPEKLFLKTKIFSFEKSKFDLKVTIKAEKGEVEVEEEGFLEKKEAQGTIKIKIVGDKGSKIKAFSRLFGKAPSRGYLECQGLMLDEKSRMDFAPELISENKKSQLFHEASIGKISEEELFYLRTRGFTEREAINIITRGFLEKI